PPQDAPFIRDAPTRESDAGRSCPRRGCRAGYGWPVTGSRKDGSDVPQSPAHDRRSARRVAEAIGSLESTESQMKKTIVGCRALVGGGFAPSDGQVDIVIDGRLIAEIRPHGARHPEGEAVDARGLLFAAGLINGPHHSHAGIKQGREDNLPLELWMNYVRPLKPIELTPREVYLRTMIGAIEAVKSGTTTLCDDTNQTPRIQPEHVEQIFQAYDDIGIRAYVGITLFDKPFFRAVPFVDEEFPPELLTRLDATKMYSADEILDFVTGLARTRNPTDNRVGYIAAPSAPQRCTEEFLRRVRRMADDHDLPVMIHVQETRMQVVTGQLWMGSTMV